jgi:hypothetical protein
MPNDCTNIITIICKNQENLSKFIKNYNSENHEIVKILKQGKYGIILNLWSAWKPDYEWTEKLLNTYEDFWIKNAWHEEGGMAGVWIGFTTEDNEIDIKHLTWRDLSIEEEYYLLNDTS